MPAKLAIAMSGGVDSSAAACLLLEQGYDLVGITMNLLSQREGVWKDGEDACAVARHLGFPHCILDLSSCFCARVIDPFVSAYEAGLTPNPCVICNRTIKFGALLDKARELGCEAIATGHYARVEYDSSSGRYLLKKALHPEKDQSYVLSTLTQEQLSHIVLPLGTLSKEEIRSIALSRGLVNADKGDSQDICFIPDGDYGAFIRRHTGKEDLPGPFLGPDGAVLGQHQGIIHYTVGQRRGLGVSSNQGRLYVREIRPEDNTVVLSDNDSLFSSTFTAGDLNLIPCDRLDGPVRLRARIRYKMAEQPCTVEQTGPRSIRVTFDQPQRAITPGQTVVLYDGDTVVGGATILKGDTAHESEKI